MAKITFEDKVALLENADIPEINKVTDGNINEIKQVVNENDDKFLTNGLNVSNEVDEDYRVNLLETKNLCSGYNQSLYINSGVNQATIVSGNTGLYIPVSGGDYTISTTDTQTIYRVGLTSNVPNTNSQTLYSGTNKDNTSDSITIDTTGYNFLCITCTDLSKIQIEKGSTATTYEEFVPSSIVVEGKKFTETIGIGTSVDSRSRVNVIKYDSSNIFTTTGATTGSNLTDTGSVNTNAPWGYTDYIEVYSGKRYNIKRSDNQTLGNTPAICFYDNSKTFISGIAYGNSRSLDLIIPSNAKYVRISYILEYSSTYTFNCIEVPSIVVDNEEIYSKPVVLWQNSSPTSAFAGQQITLSDNIENYKWYEIAFIYNTQYGYCCSTGKIPTSQKAILSVCSSIIQRRFVNALSGTSLTFLNGQKISSYNGSSTDDNTLNVPLQVIGYK